MNEPMQSGFVRRTTEVHASSMDAVEQRVRSLTFDQAVNRARHASEERELMAQAVAPLYRIIAADEAAAAAMNNLAERRRADLSRLIGRKGLTPGGSTGGSARLALGPGTSVFSPPYDSKFTHLDGDRPPTAEADADHGLVTVEIPYDEDSHGRRVATAGVSIVLETTTRGTIEVRPWIEYDYGFNISANALSAQCEGRIDITVVDDSGASLPGSEAPLWNVMTESSGGESKSDIVRSPARDVTFPARPGTQYTISVVATIGGDQSGHGIHIWPVFESYSYFSGGLDVSMPWLSVELRA